MAVHARMVFGPSVLGSWLPWKICSHSSCFPNCRASTDHIDVRRRDLANMIPGIPLILGLGTSKIRMFV